MLIFVRHLCYLLEITLHTFDFRIIAGLLLLLLLLPPLSSGKLPPNTALYRYEQELHINIHIIYNKLINIPKTYNIVNLSKSRACLYYWLQLTRYC